MDSIEYIRPGDVPARFGISVSTLYNMISDGAVKSYLRRRPGYDRGIRLVNVESLRRAIEGADDLPPDEFRGACGYKDHFFPTSFLQRWITFNSWPSNNVSVARGRLARDNVQLSLANHAGLAKGNGMHRPTLHVLLGGSPYFFQGWRPMSENRGLAIGGVGKKSSRFYPG